MEAQQKETTQDNSRLLNSDDTQNSFIQDNTQEATEVQQLQNGIEQSENFQEEQNWQTNIAVFETNQTGVPDALLQKVMQESGLDLSQVRVHYNSPKPAELGALAYTEGFNIYLAPGEEAQLEHELWHVVQQLQGRAKATEMIAGKPVDGRQGMEDEADRGKTPNQLEQKTQDIETAPIVQTKQPPTDMDRLKTILDWNNVPESEVLQILKRLSAADKATVASTYKSKLIACLDYDEMKEAVQSLKLPLKDQLTWMNDNTSFGTTFTSYSNIKSLIVAAPQAQRDALKTQKWKEYFAGICDNTTIAEAVKDLNFDLKTQEEWVRYEGADGTADGIKKDIADNEQVADAMKDGVNRGDESRWLGSGKNGTTDFAKWARSDPKKKKAAPKLEKKLVINCWEYILLVAYHEGIASQDWIHKLYTNVAYPVDWSKYMTIGGKPKEYKGVGSKEKPQRGDLVFFNDLAHVALSAGGDDIYSFWPSATTAEQAAGPIGAGADYDVDGTQDFKIGEFQVKGGTDLMGRNVPTGPIIPTPDKVELTTIDKLKKDRMGHTAARPVKVTYGSPSW